MGRPVMQWGIRLSIRTEVGHPCGTHIYCLQFSKTFLVEYRFEEIQELKFVVLDVDDRKHLDDVSRHDHIGSVECTLADIVTAGQQYKRTLREKGT